MLRKSASDPIAGNHSSGFHQTEACKAPAYLPLLAAKQSRQ